MWLPDPGAKVVSLSNSDVALKKLPGLSINFGTIRSPDVGDKKVLERVNQHHKERMIVLLG